jgi:cell division protein FtsB
MSTTNLLRKQVAAEIRKKKLVFITIVVLCFIYLSVNLIFGEAGMLRYMELNRTKKGLENQMKEITRQNEQIKAQIKLLREDPFYKEKYAREEYGLAKPDEYIFQYDK